MREPAARECRHQTATKAHGVRWPAASRCRYRPAANARGLHVHAAIRRLPHTAVRPRGDPKNPSRCPCRRPQAKPHWGRAPAVKGCHRQATAKPGVERELESRRRDRRPPGNLGAVLKPDVGGLWLCPASSDVSGLAQGRGYSGRMCGHQRMLGEPKGGGFRQKTSEAHRPARDDSGRQETAACGGRRQRLSGQPCSRFRFVCSSLCGGVGILVQTTLMLGFRLIRFALLRSGLERLSTSSSSWPLVRRGWRSRSPARHHRAVRDA